MRPDAMPAWSCAIVASLKSSGARLLSICRAGAPELTPENVAPVPAAAPNCRKSRRLTPYERLQRFVIAPSLVERARIIRLRAVRAARFLNHQFPNSPIHQFVW